MKMWLLLRHTMSRWAATLGGPFGRRMLAGVLLLSLLPLAISNGLGYFRSTGIIEGLVERYLEGIADLQGLHVRDQLERHILFLEAMATDESIRELASEAAMSDAVLEVIQPDENSMLAQQLVAHPAFEALYVFTSDGDMVASAPLPPDDLVLWIGPPLREPNGTTEIVRESRPPRVPRLRLAVPVDVPGQVERRVYLGANLPVLGPSEFLQLAEHTAGVVETFVVDEEGVPIFISHPHGMIDYGAALQTPLLEGPSRMNAAYADREGVEVIGTMVPVPDYPWRLITEVPVSDALLELRQLRQVSIWLSAFLAVLVLLLALVLAGSIVAPVRRLVMATRTLAAGDLNVRVDIRQQNEIGELGTAFNDMASELERTSQRVADLHQREIERAGQLATLGELAAGIAHEIKNPVVGISAGLDLVMRHTGDNPKLRPIVDEARRQASRIHLAINDLLAFARPKSPDLAPIDLNETVERALTLVRPTADTVGVSIDVDLGEIPKVHADREMIRQSLVNLLMNGVQASSSGARVSVATRRAAQGVEVVIHDSGKGILPEHLDQVFKPFFTTKHQGTGLGLSITRSVIEQHGGTITVESPTGKGTTFVVTLPTQGESSGTDLT